MSNTQGFSLNDLIKLYAKYKKRYAGNAYRHISKLFKEAKELHKIAFFESISVREKLKKGVFVDHEQSWRAFKGKNLEKLIQYMITKEAEALALKVINGNVLERTQKLPKELSLVKRNLAIDYGEFGLHLPDVDIIIYEPQSCKVLAVISSKVTLRERIAQTGYWKLKLLQDETTKHIKVYFVTPDEDGTLRHKKPAKKGRAIVEVDLDGSYLLTEEEIEKSEKVKLFEHFIPDLKRLLNNEE